jgi:hypothetical protein
MPSVCILCKSKSSHFLHAGWLVSLTLRSLQPFSCVGRTHRTGRWLNNRSDSHAVTIRKPCPCWEWNNCHAARRQSLCWLTYADFRLNTEHCTSKYITRWIYKEPFIFFLYTLTSKYFSIIKPTRCTNFTNLFWHLTLHVSDSSSVHHQEFIHCTLSNGICHTG